MEYWDVYELKSNRNKKCFIEYLEELLKTENYDALFRAIKSSGVYIAYDPKTTIDEKQVELVTNFIMDNLYMLSPERVDSLLKEVKTLQELRDSVLKKVNKTYKLISKQKQPYYLIEYINKFFAERSEVELYINSDFSDILDLNEEIIMSLGIILKDMSSRKIPFLVTNDPSSNEYYLIGKHLEVATELRCINNIIEMWMFGDIEINENGENGLLEIREVGNWGKKVLMSKIPFLDLKETKNVNMNKGYNSEIFNKRKVLENKIKEYFYTQDFLQKYKGIPLKDWINSYWCLYEYSLRLGTNPNIIHHSITEWEYILMNAGVSEVHVSNLLNQLTFTKSSRDLFDAPLIKFSDGLVCITNMIPYIDISRALMSQLGIQEDENNKFGSFNQKGGNFENHIELLTKKNISKVIPNLKRSVKKNELYEVDLIFQLEGNLFFVEAKTQKQPVSHKDYKRNQEELFSYIKKFNRNVNYFMNSETEKKLIMKELGMEKIEKVYRIFVTNVYQVLSFLEGVYITDEINYFCYMNRRPQAIHIESVTKRTFTKYLDPHLYQGDITSDQFLSMITNDEQNNRLIKRIGIREVDLKEQLNLIHTCYYIKNGAYKFYDGDLSNNEMFKNLYNDYL
ncbi:hypothetical protein HUG15_11430 [Salicibibacter cibarius]|uniref:NERD domain-containing protein n=1 Tax=Salicibibacter cibarius TaxID=2743000 RepID=A0A7T7CBL5_9BACI|nr:hypothetical protein [Salicibibacter cibarius]QQK76109.1 hypothetical protein HUG15_11430 [Salicibibacter cibarius]